MATSLTIGVAIVRAAFSSGASDADDLRTLLRNWTRLEERENVEQDLVASLSVPGYLETADGDGVVHGNPFSTFSPAVIPRNL